MRSLSRAFYVLALTAFIAAFSARGLAAEDRAVYSQKNMLCETRYRGFALGVTYASQVPLNRAQKSSTNFFLIRGGPVVRIASPRRAIFESFEFIPHGVIGASIHPSGIIAGLETMLRTNFSPVKKNTFFADVGAGINYLSADPKISEITGRMQFSLRSDFGIKRPLGKDGRRTWFLSVGIVHYSNNGIKRPNQGINAPAVSFGVIF